MKSKAGWWMEIFIPLITLLAITVATVGGDCAFQGRCKQYGPKLFGPCAGNETTPTFSPLPYSPRNSSYEGLLQLCPHLLQSEHTELCCTDNQATGLVKEMERAKSIIGRCPACYDNFLKLFCEFTCSPRQSDFVKVITRFRVAIENDFKPEKPTSTCADTVEYRVDKTFLEGMFDSCKEVMLEGKPALRFMCLTTPCTLEGWLASVGTKSIELSIPLSINFVHVNPRKTDRNTYMAVNYTECWNEPRKGYGSCSALECNSENFANLVDFNDLKIVEESCVFGLPCMYPSMILMTVLSVTVLMCTIAYKNQNEDHYARMKSGRIERTGVWIQKFIRDVSRGIGWSCAEKPFPFLRFGVVLVLVSMPGFYFHKESRNVLDMWSDPSSRARQEETRFISYFGAPERYLQFLLVSHKEASESHKLAGSAFRSEMVEEFFDILNDLRNLSVKDTEGRTITLNDICYRPMGPDYDCLIMSPSNYFQNNKTLMKSIKWVDNSDDFDYDTMDKIAAPYEEHLMTCIDNPMLQKTYAGISCFGTYGGPIYPRLVFGVKNVTNSSRVNYRMANALTATIMISQRNPAELERAELFEAKALKYLKKKMHETPPGTFLSFMSERSIMDEIESDAQDEVMTIVIALSFMLGYFVLVLGSYHVVEDRLITLLVHSKILLGVSTILITTLSSFAAWAFLSMFGVHPVKMALPVQFFLVTIFGTSRAYFVVHKFAEARAREPFMSLERLPEIIAKVIEQNTPEVIISSISTTICFWIGALSPYPAIKAFCLYTGLAVLIAAILHCSVFLSLFVYDCRREARGQVEIFWRVHVRNVQVAHLAGRESTVFNDIQKFFKTEIAPFLMHRFSRHAILAWFTIALVACTVCSRYVEVGFDQRTAFTEKSYMSSHLNNLETHLHAGQPVFFVVEGEMDWHKPEVQNKFCTFPGCNDLSMGNILIYGASKPETTKIYGEIYNWVDNYLQWIDRRSGCCRVYVDKPDQFCSTLDNVPDSACQPCLGPDRPVQVFKKHETFYQRPSEVDFYKFLKFFLEDTPNANCVFGGRASFGNSLAFTTRGRIQASHFMTFNTKLRMGNSSEFVDAMDKAKSLANFLTRTIADTAEVFAYGKVFPYYEQYASIYRHLIQQLAYSTVAIFFVICLFLGIDVRGSLCLAVCQVSTYVHIMAAMAVCDIPVNAISATILIASSGILIEFSVPMLRAFASSRHTSGVARAQVSFGDVAPVTLSCPVFTMIVTTLFLYGAHLPIFTTYFCTLMLIVFATCAFHALIYLPVLLSFAGPKSYRNRVVTVDDGENPIHTGQQSAEDLVNPEIQPLAANIEQASPQRVENLNPAHLLDPALVPDEGIARKGFLALFNKKKTITQSHSLPVMPPEVRAAPRAEFEIED